LNTTKSHPDVEISVSEAALLVGMSPELLSWFTSYAPKYNDSRKLCVARKIEGVLFFKKSELINFNKWLSEPWPHLEGKRPHIPGKVRDEISREVGTVCAICHGNSNACEAAHIEPVAQGKNNHPHNLIWLCANHHTQYDKGVIGPTQENLHFIKNLKVVLLARAKTVYALQAGLVRETFQLLENCRRAAQLDPTTPEQRDIAEEVGAELLRKIADIAKKKPAKTTDTGFSAFTKLVQLTANTKFTTASVQERLGALESVHDDFQLAAGMTKCPLCKGARHYKDYDDCPVCAGDGSVEISVADNFDPSDFQEIECELCEGTGNFGGYDSCPTCGGNGKLERHAAEYTDFDSYRLVMCRLCTGCGEYADYSECPFCNGERKVSRRKDDNFDPKEFGQVNCDVCNGNGRTRYYDTCRKCDGNGTLERRLHELRHKRDFELVDCPDCSGSGSSEYGDCYRCDGSGKLPRYVIDGM